MALALSGAGPGGGGSPGEAFPANPGRIAIGKTGRVCFEARMVPESSTHWLTSRILTGAVQQILRPALGELPKDARADDLTTRVLPVIDADLCNTALGDVIVHFDATLDHISGTHALILRARNENGNYVDYQRGGPMMIRVEPEHLKLPWPLDNPHLDYSKENGLIAAIDEIVTRFANRLTNAGGN